MTAPPFMPAAVLSRPVLVAAGLLAASNLFMTFASYAHLKNLHDRPWWISALLSWVYFVFRT